MYKRKAAELQGDECREGKSRRISATPGDQPVQDDQGKAVQLSSAGDAGVLPSSSEADTTCEVCDGDGLSNSVGSSVPSTAQGDAGAAHPACERGSEQGPFGASQSAAKPANSHKVKKSVRFAHGPIQSTPDGHPLSEGTTMVARAPSPYNLFTPVQPVEALTKNSLTAMEKELGDEFREENALSLVRLKRRCGIIPLKPIPRPFATSPSKSKLAGAFKGQASKKE
eukprot:jgi/Ulvmu1/12835/UM098_0017.1